MVFVDKDWIEDSSPEADSTASEESSILDAIELETPYHGC